MKLLVETNRGLKLTDSATEIIVAIEKQMAELKAQEDALCEKIIEQMKSHECNKIENAELAITYVAPTTRVSLDTTKIKKELPNVYSLFAKESIVKESIKIRCK